MVKQLETGKRNYYLVQNIRTLHKPGMAKDLIKKVRRYEMKCVTLQEIRWENAGPTKISQTIIFIRKCKNAHRLGTGFAIHESIIYTVKEFRDINPRISTLTLRTDNFDMVLTHMPQQKVKRRKRRNYFMQHYKTHLIYR